MTLFSKDLIERALKTFAQAFAVTFIGALAAPNEVTDIGAWKAILVGAAAGALTAGVSAVTSLLSRTVGDKDSASLLPAPPVVAKRAPAKRAAKPA